MSIPLSGSFLGIVSSGVILSVLPYLLYLIIAVAYFMPIGVGLVKDFLESGKV